jgi:hypothetical protein
MSRNDLSFQLIPRDSLGILLIPGGFLGIPHGMSRNGRNPLEMSRNDFPFLLIPGEFPRKYM